MPQLTLTVKYKSDSELILSPAELKSLYFFGIPLTDQSGNTISDDVLSTLIAAAQEEMEHYLSIKLKRQIYEERLDYSWDDFVNWGYLKTTFPIQEAKLLTGYLGNVKQVEYPEEWLTVKTATDEKYVTRNMYVVPTSGTITSSNSVYFGITRRHGYDNRRVPFYWNIKYCTGFRKVPKDILMALGKYASMLVFHQLGDIILGAGIANQSISIDGISQSIGTTSSATNAGYGARITGYHNDLKTTMPRLKNFYGGIPFTVC